MNNNITAELPLPNGYTLYVQDGEQGREYISDEIGGGVLVWHTALVAQSTLLTALAAEAKFQFEEAAKKPKG